MPLVNLRRAENLVTAAEYSSIAGAALGTTPPALANATLFGVPCFSITFPSGAGTYGASRYTDVFTFSASTSKKYSARAKIAFSRALTGAEAIRFRLYANTADIVNPTINTGHAANVAGAWTNLGGDAKTSTGATVALEVWASAALASALTVYVANINVFDSSGSGVLAPHEDVSVGVLSAPYHGVGVDGVKYFSTTNGNAANASTYILTEAAGTALTSGAAFIEGQATNLITAAQYRDISTWNLLGVTLPATTPTLIDGTTGGSGKNEIKEDGLTSAHRAYATFTAATAGKQSAMVAVRRGSGARHARLRLNNSIDGNYGLVVVNLDTLAAIGAVTAEYWTAYVKGAYVIIELVDTNTTTGTQLLVVDIHNGTSDSYLGDSTSSLIVDWAQVVTSGLAQSHIQGAATRYASFLSRPWIGATINFWVYVDLYLKYSSQAFGSNQYYCVNIRKDANNYLMARLLYSGGDIFRVTSSRNGTFQFIDATPFSVDRGDRVRFVASFDEENGLRFRAVNQSTVFTGVIAQSRAPIAALSSGATIYLGSDDGAAASSVNSAEYVEYKVGTGILSESQQIGLVGA